MTDQTPFIAEILDDLTAELEGRLQVQLSEQDRAAVGTAIAKATMRGFLRGSAETAGQINENWRQKTRAQLLELLPPGTELPNELADVNVQAREPDVWAERYGEKS